MTQQTPQITFNLNETLAILMALEFVKANPHIMMEFNGEIITIKDSYFEEIKPIRHKIIEFIKEVEKS